MGIYCIISSVVQTWEIETSTFILIRTQSTAHSLVICIDNQLKITQIKHSALTNIHSIHYFLEYSDHKTLDNRAFLKAQMVAALWDYSSVEFKLLRSDRQKQSLHVTYGLGLSQYHCILRFIAKPVMSCGVKGLNSVLLINALMIHCNYNQYSWF